GVPRPGHLGPARPPVLQVRGGHDGGSRGGVQPRARRRALRARPALPGPAPSPPPRTSTPPGPPRRLRTGFSASFSEHPAGKAFGPLGLDGFGGGETAGSLFSFFCRRMTLVPARTSRQRGGGFGSSCHKTP